MVASDFPPDCVQSLIAPWWVPLTSGTLERGRLLWAFVPIIGQSPRTLTPSRTGATEHGSATFVLEALRPSQRTAPTLPVAALPLHPGEVHAVYKAKKRPVVVLGVGSVIDPRSFGGGKGWQTAPMLMVAPYFGVEGGTTRGGWHPEFVRRIRHAEYPSYVYDRLPIGAAEESILRLDQMQPLGNHHDSYDRTDWQLSQDALTLDRKSTRLNSSHRL